MAPELLNALLAVDKTTIPTEIILVSDYPVFEMGKEFPSVKFIETSLLSIAAKRNIGIEAASAPVCAFIDDDCIPHKNWIADAIAWMDANPEAAGVEGSTHVERGASGAVLDAIRLEKPAYRTNNIFYRRDALMVVGMFDERFEFQREDVDLAFTLLDKGYSIGYSKYLRVMHRFRHDEPFDLLKNCWRRRFDPLLFRKHPIRYREHIGTPVTPAIAAIGVAHVASLLLFHAPLQMLILPLILSAAFALRRAAAANTVATLLPDILSFFVSPFVLWAALVAGSIRFRKILLV